MTTTTYKNHTLVWEKSPLKNKKYRVWVLSPTNTLLGKVDFGALKDNKKGYQHYKDSTPLKLYSYLDHNDKDRRDRYRARHSKIKLKDGRFAYTVPFTASWFSWHFLW
jgi:hypothetical protein